MKKPEGVADVLARVRAEQSDEITRQYGGDCPVCGGGSDFIGTLGASTYNRCRDCGLTFEQGD